VSEVTAELILKLSQAHIFLREESTHIKFKMTFTTQAFKAKIEKKISTEEIFGLSGIIDTAMSFSNLNI
jgi:hypothetical protein